MRLRALVVENYKCFAKRTEFDFTRGEEDQGRNVYLIGGTNGVGKTTILEAINICLYGEKENVIAGRINRDELARGNACCAFALEFDTGDGNVLRLRRTWDGRASHPATTPRLTQSVSLEIPGRDMTQNEALFDAAVAQYIPRGITQFFFFDGEKIQEMADDEGDDYRLQASMEAALGVENVRRLRDDIKHLRRQEQRADSHVSGEDVQLKERQLETLSIQRDEIEGKQRSLELEIKDFEEERRDLDAKFQHAIGCEPEAQERYQQAERRRAQLRKQINDLEKSIRGHLNDRLALALLGEHFDDLQRQMDVEAKPHPSTFPTEYAPELTEAVYAAICRPDSGWLRPLLSPDDLAALQSAIAATIRDFALPEDMHQPLLGFSTAERVAVTARIHELAGGGVPDLKRVLTEKRAAENQLAETEAQLSGHEPSPERAALTEKLLTQIRTCEKHIGQKRAEYQTLDDDRLRILAQITEIENQLDMLYDSYDASQGQLAFRTRCEELESFLDDYIEALRESRLERLEMKTLEMYKKLATKGDLISSITIDRNSYQVKIHNTQGHTIQKRNLSAGEKEVFAISLLWGLAQTSELSLPIIVDTPLSRLDRSHRDAIVADYFPAAGEQVIVLSTDTEVDRQYYEKLEPHLKHKVRLVFHRETETTTVEEGYFIWGD